MAAGSLCGTGAPTLELGREVLFVANPSGRFRIERGTQGGHHIHVSLRVQGEIDPDHADIELRLLDGDALLARHVNQDALLHIEAGGCDYPVARLVLMDEAGGLLPEARVLELVGAPLELAAGVDTPRGNARAVVDVVLDAPE